MGELAEHRTVDVWRHVCRLRAAPLAEAGAWLRWHEPFWDDRLDALAHLFREARPDPNTPAIPDELDGK